MVTTCQQTTLGRWLAECRGTRTQFEVAARIHMDQSEWSKWETGERRRATPEKLVAFATALGRPVESMALAYAGLWPPHYGEIADNPTRGPLTPPDLFAAASDLSERLAHQSSEVVQGWLAETFGVQADTSIPAHPDNTAEQERA